MFDPGSTLSFIVSEIKSPKLGLSVAESASQKYEYDLF